MRAESPTTIVEFIGLGNHFLTEVKIELDMLWKHNHRLLVQNNTVDNT